MSESEGEVIRELTDAEFEVLRSRVEVRDRAQESAELALSRYKDSQSALQDVVAAFAGGYDEDVDVEYDERGARIVRKESPEEKVEEAAEKAAALVDGELTEETEEED